MAPSEVDRTNIWIAASDGDLNAVKHYIASGLVVVNEKDENGYTALHAAASYGHLELLQWLLINGGDPNIQDNDGDTPLHVCETVGAARLLVEHGCDPALRNFEGVLPIEAADEEEWSDVVGFLKDFTPDYREAARDVDLDGLVHVEEAEDGEALMSVDVGRLAELVQSGAMDEIIERQKALEDAENANES